MAKKYNFSVKIQTVNGEETFGIDGADSFDEAQKWVFKGISDRKLELEKPMPTITTKISVPPVGLDLTSTSTTPLGTTATIPNISIPNISVKSKFSNEADPDSTATNSNSNIPPLTPNKN